MIDSQFHMHEHAVHGASMDPVNIVPIRQGRHYPTLSPAVLSADRRVGSSSSVPSGK